MRPSYRLWGFFLISLTTLAILITDRGLASYTNSQFSVVAGNDVTAEPGDTSVFLGRITLPTPSTDTQVVNGSSATIAAGDTLSEFASTDKFFDLDTDSTFDAGEGVFTSSDAILSQDDTVVTVPSGWSFDTFGGSESGQAMYGFVDADSDSTLDYGEDVVRQIYSGTTETLTSGDQLKVLPAGEVYYVAQAGSSVYSYSWPGAIIDFQTSNLNWNLIQSGKMNYLNFDTADNVCVNDKDSNGVYSVEDIIWRDLNGADCQTFDTGVDVIVVSEGGTVTTPNMEITGAEVGVSYGFMDGDGDGNYDCNRTSCEAMILAVADYADGATLSKNNTYIMGCPDAGIDDVAFVGTCYSEDPTLANLYDLSTQSASTGEERFMFVDSNADGNFQGDQEDIVMVVAAGATDVLSTGDTFRTLGANDKYLDYNSNDSFEATEGDVLIRSANGALDLGLLNGTATDTLLTLSTINNLTAFSATTKFHNSDGSGGYADGDDIIRDVDSSGYYNADDLTAAAVEAAGSYAVTDSDLDALYVYGRSDTSCAGGGSTLLGSDVSAPILNTSIALTRAPYTTAETVVLCLFADIDAAATPGRVFNPRFGTTDLTFSSGGSPSDSAVTLATDSTAVNIISTDLDATLVANSLIKSRSTTYTASFTSSVAIADGGGVSLTFPDGYSLTSATMTCTENGGNLTGSSGVSGQTITFTLSGDSVADEAAIVCTAATVTNPSATGVTGTFSIASRSSVSSQVSAEIDAADTVTIIASSGGGGGFTPVKTEVLEITKPVASDLWANGSWYLIEWQNAGNIASSYVNISLTDSRGVRTVLAENASNTGVKSIYLAGIASGQATLRVEGTDLVTTGAGAEVSLNITENGVEVLPPETGLEEVAAYCEADGRERLEAYVAPNLSQSLVKTPASSTVFYRASNGMLRPFFTEPHFFAWGLKFSDVITVSTETLSNLKFGAPMPPAPGTSLVKSPLGPEVYVLEPNLEEQSEPILHWLASEEVATAYFGVDWSRRVTDVSPAIIAGSVKGLDVELACRPWYVDIN